MKSVTLALILTLTVVAFAQQPLGTVSNRSTTTCPSWTYKGMSCSNATVSCPGTADMKVTYAVVNPPIPTKATVAILFGTNTKAIAPNANAAYIMPYLAAGFQVVEFNWTSQWEDTNLPSKSVLTAACRPATMLQYIHDSIKPAGAKFAAQGFSAGAGAVGYALAEYGLGPELDAVELLSGPVYSNILTGCKVPLGGPVKVVPTDGTPFYDSPLYGSAAGRISLVSGYTCEPNSNTSTAANAAWIAMSTVGDYQSGVKFPTTHIAGWVCNNALNPTAAQGFLFLRSVTSPWNLTSITNCYGAEGVGSGTTPNGTNGSKAISADMIAALSGVRSTVKGGKK